MTNSEKLARHAVEAACAKSGVDPVLLDVTALCSYTDYILIISGRSVRQVSAIAEAVQLGMKQLGHDPIGCEGMRGGPWSLLDYGDVIVHVFYEGLRGYYDLEGLWNDAERIVLRAVQAPRASVSVAG